MKSRPGPLVRLRLSLAWAAGVVVGATVLAAKANLDHTRTLEAVMRIDPKVAIAAIVLLGSTDISLAQSSSELPVPGIEAARDVPGAMGLPDPNGVHKVVFDMANAAPAIDDVNPMLLGIARFINTLGKYGVPAENRQIAVVLHQGATEIILQNEPFKARNDGHDNPNVELIRDLANAGVQFHVCGQAVLAYDIDPDTILPEIQLDLWALTTLTALQGAGYVLVGG